MKSKSVYPLIDRSDAKISPDEHNIGFNEGLLSDGRPYRLECWAIDQITNITIFISTIGIEQLASEKVMTFLENENLFKVLSGGYGGEARKFTDKNGNEFWSANLVIGDDEDTYATSDVPLKPMNGLPRPAEHSNSNKDENPANHIEADSSKSKHSSSTTNEDLKLAVLEAAAERSGISMPGNRELLDYRKQILPFGKVNLEQVRKMVITDIVEGRWDQDLSEIKPPLTEEEIQNIENYLAGHPGVKRPKGLPDRKKNTDERIKKDDYIETELLHKAIKFAALAHRGHTRKKTETPYIVHPFETALILSLEGCSIDVIIAGLLHDTVEDTTANVDEISKEFGNNVAGFVSACTEDKSKSWEVRKRHTINFLAKETNFDILKLVCADKLSNLRSMKLDYEEYGEELWKRFNKGKESQKWYFSGIIDSLHKLEGSAKYEELISLYNIMFR